MKAFQAMQAGLTGLKVLVLMVVAVVVSGCAGHINLAKNDFVIKNAADPEVIFVIEDRHFSDWFVVGVTIEISSLKEISKAINTTFHDKAFAIYPSDKANNIDISRSKVVKITPIEFNLYKPVGFFYIGKFVADVSINNKTKRIEGEGKESSIFALETRARVITLSDNTFLDFAKSLRKELGKR
jgi:hypothetical protein